MRATVAVFLSIPLSALAAFIALSADNNTVNAMILGPALAFSRLIDNSVVCTGKYLSPSGIGRNSGSCGGTWGREVALPVLAATLATAVVFFPVTFLYGVSRFLFGALALSVILSLFASYFVAMTVVPLFCAKLIRGHQERKEVGHGEDGQAKPHGWGQRFNAWFNHQFNLMLDRYEGSLHKALLRPVATVLGITGIFILSLGLYPLVGQADPRPIPASLSSTSKHPPAPGSNSRTNWWGRLKLSCAKWCR